MKHRCKQIIATVLAAAMLVTLLSGCRASEVLTRTLNIDNALDLGNSDARTDRDEDENIPDDEDPVNEEDEDAKLQEQEIKVGQLMADILEDEDLADAALQAIFSDDVYDDEWGSQYLADGSSPNADTLVEEDYGTEMGASQNGSQTSSSGGGASSANTKTYVSSLAGTSPTASATTNNGQTSQDIGTNSSEDGEHTVTVSSGQSGSLSNAGSYSSGDGTESSDVSGSRRSDDESDANLQRADRVTTSDTTVVTGNSQGTGASGNWEHATDDDSDQNDQYGGSSGSEGDTPLINNEERQVETEADEEGGRRLQDAELEEADKTGGVAAVGQLAITVSMLSGGGTLCATSADYDENELAQKAFGGDSDYEVLWSGDGSSHISDANFQKLLNMKPALVVEENGSDTFTQTQLNQLRSQGCTYAILPGFDTIADTTETMSVLANLLGDRSTADTRGSKNAAEVFELYQDFCDEIESEISGYKLSSARTVYIEGWDPDAMVTEEIGSWDESTSSYKISESIDLGRGCAYIRQGGQYTTGMDATAFRPLHEYLGYANLEDYATMMYSVNTYYTGSKYATSSGADIPAAFAEDGEPYAGCYAYICPIFPGTGTSPVFTITNARSDIWVMSNTMGAVGGLGLDNSTVKFKTVIAADQGTKACIERAWSWAFLEESLKVTGVNAWVRLGPFGASTGITRNGYEMNSNIVGTYDVYVNPSGLGDWVNGSPESILEAAWAAWRLQGALSQSTVQSLVRSFYANFYDYDLSASELADIMDGETGTVWPDTSEEYPGVTPGAVHNIYTTLY